MSKLREHERESHTECEREALKWKWQKKMYLEHWFCVWEVRLWNYPLIHFAGVSYNDGAWMCTFNSSDVLLYAWNGHLVNSHFFSLLVNSKFSIHLEMSSMKFSIVSTKARQMQVSHIYSKKKYFPFLFWGRISRLYWKSQAFSLSLLSGKMTHVDYYPNTKKHFPSFIMCVNVCVITLSSHSFSFSSHPYQSPLLLTSPFPLPRSAMAQRTIVEFILCLGHVSLKDETQIIRVQNKYLYLLAHLCDTKKNFSRLSALSKSFSSKRFWRGKINKWKLPLVLLTTAELFSTGRFMEKVN